ncbi:hypothetical protein [Bordetella pertussis]|uniref:hypothetical protein n=1 Tax=Bordetella pertussis TaxID=520 RepID=UPI0039B74786
MPSCPLEIEKTVVEGAAARGRPGGAAAAAGTPHERFPRNGGLGLVLTGGNNSIP